MILALPFQLEFALSCRIDTLLFRAIIHYYQQFQTPKVCLMKKVIVLSALFLFATQPEVEAQGAAVSIKKSARKVAGKGPRVMTGQTGASGGVSGSSSAGYKAPPRIIPDRTRTPHQLIVSAITWVKSKNPLTDEHREKLATAMFAAGEASGAKVKPETITKVSYAVADAVNKVKLGYSGRKKLADALLNVMAAGAFTAEDTEIWVGAVRYAFAGTAASEKELDSIATSLNGLIAEQKQTVSK